MSTSATISPAARSVLTVRMLWRTRLRSACGMWRQRRTMVASSQMMTNVMPSVNGMTNMLKLSGVIISGW